ncbi:hypothetical protein D3C87_1365110 [compost metagenome]
MPKPRDLVAHRCGINRRIGLEILVALADQAQQLLEADELLQERVGVACQMAHTHQFDEAQFIAALQAVIKQRHHLIEVLTAQRHHVDLDLHAGRAGLLHAVEHRRQIAATGDAAKCTGVEGVEGNVDAPNAGIHQ